MKVAVVGAGLGGLAAAVCLAKAGHEVVVFEKREGLSTNGGIISLRPGALKILRANGLQDAIDSISLPLGETQFKMLHNGQAVRNLDLHDEVAGDEGLSIVTIRPKLAKVLYDAAFKAGATIKFNTGVDDVVEDRKSASLHLDDGSTHTADLVLVVDGIRSKLRSKVLPDTQLPAYEPVLMDAIFYVFRLPADRLSEDVKKRTFESNGPWLRMTAWIGQDTWAMTCFDTRDDRVNVGVTIVEPTSQTSLWDENGGVDYIRDFFKDRACGDILEALHATDQCDRWRIAYMPELPRWSSIGENGKGGRVALVGDACHAILPNGGAGISMTMEDVGVLTYLLSRQGDASATKVPETLRLWQEICKPSANRLREFGLFNNRCMKGVKEDLARREQAIKDEASSGKTPVPDMDAQFSTKAFAKWLSGYDPIASADQYIASKA